MKLDQATGLWGWDRRLERCEAATSGQPGEAGEPALVDQLLGDLVVHAVEAEDDEARAVRVATGRAADRDGRQGERQEQEADRAGLSCAHADCSASVGVVRKSTFPSMCFGGSNPKSRKAVGAMSMSAGSGSSTSKLLKRTPGTSRGSMQ